jgi:23S rRNA (adenine2503-C2)-methyltransferase
MLKENLLGYTKPDMERLMTSLGEKPFRGRQLFKWLYNTRQYDFHLMTDLTRELRSKLAERYTFKGLVPEAEQKSADGTVKCLFRLSDNHPVESVLIPDDTRGSNTVCLSSQVGCGLGCAFCATAAMGLLRNLTVGEMVGQLEYLREHPDAGRLSHVVFMGMGEPLKNYRNLVESIRIMTDTFGFGLSHKKVTVSTCGISPMIKKLADSGLRAKLAVSLNAALQEKRATLMPVAKTYGLSELMDATRYYAEKVGSRVTFEYILLDGINDTTEDVTALSKLIRGLPCKINVLAYNPVPRLPYRRPSDEKVDWFGRQLYPRAPAVTVRKSRGKDIDAACGQLAGRVRL